MRDFELLRAPCRQSEVDEQTRVSTIHGGAVQRGGLNSRSLLSQLNRFVQVDVKRDKFLKLSLTKKQHWPIQRVRFFAEFRVATKASPNAMSKIVKFSERTRIDQREEALPALPPNFLRVSRASVRRRSCGMLPPSDRAPGCLSSRESLTPQVAAASATCRMVCPARGRMDSWQTLARRATRRNR
jgi:hypothetical protein